MKKGMLIVAAVMAILAFGFGGIQTANAQGSVIGTVIDADGNAVAAAHVVIHGERQMRGQRPFMAQTETDENGAFGFDEVPAGAYIINAGAPELGRALSNIEIADQQVIEIQLQLEGRPVDPEVGIGSISGTVIDADGNAVAEARVMLQRQAMGRGRNIRHIAAVTDENGAFSFADVPAGNYTVIAGARELGMDREAVEVVADQNSEVELQLALRQGGGDDEDPGNGGDRPRRPRNGRGGRGGGN